MLIFDIQLKRTKQRKKRAQNLQNKIGISFLKHERTLFDLTFPDGSLLVTESTITISKG